MVAEADDAEDIELTDLEEEIEVPEPSDEEPQQRLELDSDRDDDIGTKSTATNGLEGLDERLQTILGQMIGSCCWLCGM